MRREIWLDVKTMNIYRVVNFEHPAVLKNERIGRISFCMWILQYIDKLSMMRDLRAILWNFPRFKRVETFAQIQSPNIT